MKPSIKIAIAIIAALFIGVFVYITVLNIRAFEALSDIDVIDSAYQLKQGRLVLKNVRTLKDDTLRFKDFTIINFWATWCKPCIEEQPMFEALSTSLPSVKVVQLSFDSLKVQSEFLNKRGWTLPAYFVADTSHFPIPALLPKTLLIKDNKVLMEFYGIQQWNAPEMRTLLDSLNQLDVSANPG